LGVANTTDADEEQTQCADRQNSIYYLFHNAICDLFCKFATQK
jgi:hypothetical protein